MKFIRGAPLSRTQWVRWAGVLGIAGGLILLGHVLGITMCPLRRWTGIPCPTCGGTRAVVALLTGRFSDAFHIHPLVTVAVMGGAVMAGVESLCVLLKCRAPRLILSKAERNIAVVLMVILLVAQWVWKSV